MMPSYSESFIRDRVKSGKDANRARTADELAAKATQPPHDDDAAALSQLRQLSGDDSTGGWGTNDARNYGRFKLSQITGQGPEYSEARDGGGLLGGFGKTLGGVLKVAAPFAGLIPGVGIPLAAGLGAGASALGGAMRGEPFSLGKTALAGAAGAGGAYLTGGQGVNGLSRIPAKLGLGGGGAGPGVGNATQGMGGVASAAPSGGGGFLGGGSLLDKIGRYGPLVAGGLGVVGNYQDQSRANDLRERGIASAERGYADRAPFRMRATDFANAPMPTRPDLSGIFADPGNPFNRIQRAA